MYLTAWFVTTKYPILYHLMINIRLQVLYKRKPYSNSEAEAGKKKKQINNILRLESSKTKN